MSYMGEINIDDHILAYRTDQACQILNISDKALRAMTNKGIIKGIRFGNKFIYSRRCLEEFLLSYEGKNLSDYDDIKLICDKEK